MEFIDGIEVLASSVATESPLNSFGVIMSIFLVFICIMTLLIIAASDKKDNLETIILVSLFVVALPAVLVFTIGSDTIEFDTYTILISENVCFREFDSLYEVVERDGEIFTVRAR